MQLHKQTPRLTGEQFQGVARISFDFSDFE
jgi:hypothetical protein